MIIESALTKRTYFKISFNLLFRDFNLYFVLVLSAGIFMVTLFTNGFSFENIILSLFALVIFWIIVILFALIIISFHTFSSRNKNFFLPSRYVFDDVGISLTNDLEQSITKWAAIKKWNVIAGCYVVFKSGITFLAVQKTAIPIQEIPIFESILRNNIKKK
jgi:hypothetical protein